MSLFQSPGFWTPSSRKPSLLPGKPSVGSTCVPYNPERALLALPSTSPYDCWTSTLLRMWLLYSLPGLLCPSSNFWLFFPYLFSWGSWFYLWAPPLLPKLPLASWRLSFHPAPLPEHRVAWASLTSLECLFNQASSGIRVLLVVVLLS